jgi:hypothetical protein
MIFHKNRKSKQILSIHCGAATFQNLETALSLATNSEKIGFLHQIVNFVGSQTALRGQKTTIFIKKGVSQTL